MIEDETKVIKKKKKQNGKQLDKYYGIEEINIPINRKKEIFNKLFEKAMNELHDALEFNNLLYHYKSSNKDVNCNSYNDTKRLFNMIKNKAISLINAETNETEFKSKLKNIKINSKTSTLQKK